MAVIVAGVQQRRRRDALGSEAPCRAAPGVRLREVSRS
jgi:hypothetical protein